MMIGARVIGLSADGVNLQHVRVSIVMVVSAVGTGVSTMPMIINTILVQILQLGMGV